MTDTKRRFAKFRSSFFSEKTDTLNGVWVGLLTTLALGVQAINRGSDYLTGAVSTSQITSYVDIVGTRGWGWAFTLVGLIAVAAASTRRCGPLAIANVLLGCLYLGFCITIGQGVVSAGDGWRAIPFAAVVVPMAWATLYLRVCAKCYVKLAVRELLDRDAEQAAR